MSVKIYIHPKVLVRKNQIDHLILEEKLSLNHPDLLLFADEDKLGVLQTKKIKEFLSLKPYSGQNRVVIFESAQNLTVQAQNSLLKLLEEPPLRSRIILCASSESALLPTILSRCEIIYVEEDSGGAKRPRMTRYREDIEKLFEMSIAQRFRFIESLNEKEVFLNELVVYFQESLRNDLTLIDFTKKLLEAEEWVKSSVNIRGILEYLMLNLPKKE